MALLNNLLLEKTADLMRVEGQDLGVFILSEGDQDTVKVLSYSASESISGKVELPSYSTSTDGLRLSERPSVIATPQLTLEQVFENRENVLEALIGEKGAPAPIFEALRVLESRNYIKLRILAKTCASKAQQEMIDNYEYDRSFKKAQLAGLDDGQQKIFRKAQKIVLQVAFENKLSIQQVLNDLSIVSFNRDLVAISLHVLKFNALRRKANKMLKQKGEERISLSNAFLAYRDCANQIRNNIYRELSYNNRNLVMLPVDIQLFLSKSESKFSFDFSGCSLVEFPECVMRPGIRDLNLAGNLISEIPDYFQNCGDLNAVRLSDTMISSLPPSLLLNPSLGRLYISNTAVNTVPLELNTLPLITTEDEYVINALAVIDFTGNGIIWKNLSHEEKKVIRKIIDLRTQVDGIDLPKHLRLKNKIKDISLRKSLKQHVLKV